MLYIIVLHIVVFASVCVLIDIEYQFLLYSHSLNLCEGCIHHKIRESPSFNSLTLSQDN